MTFAPYVCSTPKFVPVLNQPSHFILAAPTNSSVEHDRQLTRRNPRQSTCRPLKKCQSYHWKQSNASTAINRQHHFDNDTTVEKNSLQHRFFCLPFNLFQRSKRRHRPCHV